ncbi:hypothetical protein [Tenacibaculum halocynthiae]|uniref:hypothetical protein n=1 Tax=Tenacibaculum halocynthiae TaxID=1254437 RepID=UPI003893F129
MSIFIFLLSILAQNATAMVSIGIKIPELPIKHLAKNFHFVFSALKSNLFHISLTGNLKRFGGHYKNTINLGLNIKTCIEYYHC